MAFAAGMKLLVTILVVVSAYSIAFSQKIEFYFTDSLDAPISNVTVFSQELNHSYFSDGNGYLEIDLTQLEEITFLLFKEGFFSQELIVKQPEVEATYYIKLLPISAAINEVVIQENGNNSLENLAMRSIENLTIYNAKKTEKIILSETSANKATNNNRQLFAKVAGLNVWESQGSGLSTEIGGRGLSPERSSNFNIRQNGYDISADALGYPDAYYVPPADAVSSIKVTRGAASLQYGTQIGGVVDYQLKEAAKHSPLAFTIQNTVGSYGFFSTYNQLSGTHRKTSYFIANKYNRGNGWRDNSGFHSNYTLFQLYHKASEKLVYGLEYTYYTYLAQQAGGLTDAAFNNNPQQSIRNRNWFNVKWHLPQFKVNYTPSKRVKMESIFFGLVAERNAAGFLGNITRIDPLTERDLLVDHYKNIGNESRLLLKYSMFNQLHAFLIGTRIYSGFTQKQQGLTDAKNGPSFSYLNPTLLETSDFDFPSRNMAIFTENIFRLTSQWSITPGLRFEHINTSSEGYYRNTNRDLAGNILLDTIIYDEQSKGRNFLLAGLGASFKPNSTTEVYASISQNYRAVNFNDLRIVNPSVRIDPNLTDERGYNADIGIRGRIKDAFTYDISAFMLQYNNRIGFALQTDSLLFNTYRFRTNIAASRTLGIESVFEIDYLRIKPNPNKDVSLRHFLTFSFIEGKYINSNEPAFNNKKVELVPNVLVKSALRFKWKEFIASYQISYIGSQFTDATNSTFTSDAVNGLIPAYWVSDVNLSYTFKWLKAEFNINNLANNTYFTRRAIGYPGPGIIPADGRTFYLTLGIDINKK